MINYLIYNFLFLISLMSSKIKYYNIVLLFIIVTLFASLRYNVGPDYESYVNSYYTIVKYNLVSSPDYLLFHYLSSLFSIYMDRGYIAVFAIYFSITFLLILKVLDNRKILFFGIFVFFSFGFFFDSLDRIRQYLALAIFFYALTDIENNNFITYFIKIILASFIHMSAFLLIPFYFISKLKINKKIMLILLIIMLILSFIGGFHNFVNMIYSYIPYYNEKYYNSSFALSQTTISLGFLGRALVLIITVVLAPINEKLRTIIFFGIVFILIGEGNLNISRFSAYLLSPIIIALPLLLKKIKNKNYFYILIPTLLFLIILFEFDINRNNFEYQSIFSKDFKYEIFKHDN